MGLVAEGLTNAEIADREVCEVTVQGSGRRVRARAAAADTFSAIDLAVDKLEHQLVTLKSKTVGRSHGDRRPALATDEVVEDE
jgi:ribosomal subunit interface protein